MLNCFKYFLIYVLGQNVPKYQTREILNHIKSSCVELFKIFFTIYFETKRPKKIRQQKRWTISSLHVEFSVRKCSNTFILYLHILLMY